MSTEVKVEKIPWALIVLLTIIFGFFGPVHASMSPNASWYALGSIGCKFMLLVMPLLFIMGATVIGKLVGKPISATTCTFLYAAGIPLIVYAGSQAFPIGGAAFVEIQYDRLSLAPEIDPWPSLLAPSAEVIAPMVSGGAAVPWGAWIPTMTWWWLLYATCAVFSIGWGIVWRRRWIDVEKVPFPHARIAIELIDRATSTKRSLKERLGLPFLIGLLLGVAFQLPLLFAYMYPWFPDIYGWRTNTCTHGTQWITPDSPLAGIVGLAMFNKDPALGAVFYMAPLNILLGIWFWYLLFVILMQIAYSVGYYTGITGNSGCGRVWCGTIGYRIGEPFKWDVFTSAGVTTGIFIGYILLNWRYLAETFNAAIGKLEKSKLEEFDRTEPTSYRNAYIMIAGSAIMILALFMTSEVGFPAALLLIITFVVVSLVQTRSYSLVGFVVPGGSTFYHGPMKMLVGSGLEGATTEWYMSINFTYVMACEPLMGGGVGWPLASSLSVFQMANVNKVSVKSIFKILLFVSILAPLVSVAGAIWGFYTFGVTKMPTSVGRWGSAYESWSPTGMARRPAYEPWWPNMLAGIIFAFILSFLHARFVWFPLEPIGFLLATDGHALIEGIWTMGLAAWILKAITLRVGGSKLYERTGIPTAIGFVIGVVIISIIGGFLLTIRFFYPY